MRILGALATALLIFLAFATASAQPADGADATYWLHAVGECADGEIDSYMDQENSEGDLHGCGVIAPVPGATIDNAYPGKDTLGRDLGPGATASAHIWLTTNNPARVTVQIAFVLGRLTCSGASGEQLVLGPVAGYTEFVVPCAFQGNFDEPTHDVLPSLTVGVTSDVTHFYGYEGDQASRVDLFGLAAEAPSPGAPPGPDGEGGDRSIPGPGVVLVLAGAAGAALAASRRGRVIV